MTPLLTAARLVFGAWMAGLALAFFLALAPVPAGHTPLAVQLITALAHSRLLDVALAIQLVCGVLILAGLLVPAALAVVMPITTCAAFWAAGLDRAPLGAALSLAALALNGLLMLAYLDSYRTMLQRRALAAGEA